jgi:hypothetical protein
MEVVFMTLPILKEWKKALQTELDKYGNTKNELAQVITVCDQYAKEIQGIINWLSDNHAFVIQIQRQYRELYHIRFGESLPEVIPQGITSLKVLNNEQKKEEILKLVQAVPPGSKISAQDVLKSLEQKGFKVKAANPHAAVSTTMFFLKNELEKSGDFGVFIRRQPIEG